MTLETINLVIIAIAGILILATAFFKRDKNLVTLIWILGTFLWIILGLMAFNTTDIEWSIAGLLNGLKTAFVTSIFGLAASLFLWFIEKKDDTKDDSDFLIEIRDEIKKLWKTQNQNADDTINKEILTELKSINTGNIKLQKSFDNFSKEISENNTKSLVDAMGAVMKDFNSKINDQLGESFSQLSSSVESLVRWQENYQQTVESTTKAFHASKQSLEASVESLKVSSKASEIFVQTSQTLDKKLVTLTESLQLFKKWTSEFESVAQSVGKMSDKMIASIDTLSHVFVQKAERIISESEKQITTMTTVFSNQSADLVEAHQTIVSRMKKDINNNNKSMSDSFLRMWVRLEQQVQNLDEQLGRELEKSLNSLGQQLTSLSEKFVSDYGSLAEKLEKIK